MCQVEDFQTCGGCTRTAEQYLDISAALMPVPAGDAGTLAEPEPQLYSFSKLRSFRISFIYPLKNSLVEDWSSDTQHVKMSNVLAARNASNAGIESGFVDIAYGLNLRQKRELIQVVSAVAKTLPSFPAYTDIAAWPDGLKIMPIRP
jgi:hypothetical protein